MCLSGRRRSIKRSSGERRRQKVLGPALLLLLCCCQLAVWWQQRRGATTTAATSSTADNSSSSSSSSHSESLIPSTIEYKPPYKHDPKAIRYQTQKCTAEQLKVISEHLFWNCEGHWWGCGIVQRTKCPQATWFSRHQMDKRDSASYFVGISIGCNKGYDAIQTARIGMANAHFNTTAWSNEADAFGLPAVGACNQKNEIPFPLDDDLQPRKGEMHCVEPSSQNIPFLEEATRRLELAKEGFVVTRAACSASDGIIYFPKKGKKGDEEQSMANCMKPGMEDRCEPVPMYSLQTYVEKFVASTGPINILSIDVEGYDFEVLFGAGSVLDRTEYLEFEYHAVGRWSLYHLWDAVLLLEAKGFTCYWAGSGGNLWRITGCFHDVYDTFHGWSNLACVHQSQRTLAEQMETVFLETLATK